MWTNLKCGVGYIRRRVCIFFGDRKEVNVQTYLTANLVIHSLDDQLFLRMMAGAKAYATTAGFESVCEAMYLQKPVLMVPTHIEQECNAMDAIAAGASVCTDSFNLNLLHAYIPYYRKSHDFEEWVRSAEPIFLNRLTGFGASSPIFVYS